MNSGHIRVRHISAKLASSLQLFLFAWCMLLASKAMADATMTNRSMTASTICQIYVERDHIRLDLEIGESDLLAFKSLLPDELLRSMKVEAPALEDRVHGFFNEGFIVMADEGNPLKGKIVSMGWKPRVTRDEITGDPLTTNEAEKVLRVILSYPFSEKPQSLRVTPPLNAQGDVSANIGFVAYHQGLPVNDFRYLSCSRSLDLDWEDPWYSKFRHKNFLRKFNEPINAFLYVEPYETRVEVIIRPKDLQQWVDLGIESKETLPVSLQDELKEKAAAYLAEQVILEVDGKRVTPTLDRIHFLRRSLRASAVIDPAEELDAKSAMLGVIFVHRTAALPNKAELTWNLFSPKLPKVRSGATDEAGALPYILQPDDNVLKWQNFLKHPTIPKLIAVTPPNETLRWSFSIASVVCLVGFIAVLVLILKRRQAKLLFVGAILLAVSMVARPYTQISIVIPFAVPFVQPVPLTTEESKTVMGTLLRNVYVAFDFRDDDEIYDTLGRSADGDLLTTIYLDIRKSLELQNQGGARVKVKNVELVEMQKVESGDGGGFKAKCKWNVQGSVGHWGHLHQRTNQYEALIHIKPVNGEWKIVELELLHEERVL